MILVLCLAVMELPSRKIIFPSRLLHGEKMQNSRSLPMFMLGSCFIFQDNVPLNKSPCFALCCREVSAFPCLRLGFYWRSDFDVYASSFLPAYQPASNSSLKSHVACFVYIVLFSTFWNWTIWNVWLLVLNCNRYTVLVWYHRNHVCRLILSCI